VTAKDLAIVPWARGRSLVRDFTCPDTLASKHLNRAVLGPGAVVNEAEEKFKYSSLHSLYDFTTIAVETFGVVRESAIDFLQVAASPIQLLSRVLSRFSCSVSASPCSVAMLSASLALHRRPLVWTMKSLYYYNYISTLYD